MMQTMHTAKVFKYGSMLFRI